MKDEIKEVLTPSLTEYTEACSGIPRTLTRAQVRNRRRLIRALYSGRYKQVQGRLRIADRHCCLGVLCDISHLGKWRRVQGEPHLRYDLDGDVQDNVPQLWLLGMFGLTLADATALWNMNDMDGGTFPEIAMALEFLTLADADA